VPARLRDIEKTGLSTAARKWIDEHYPAAMRVAGAPVITERSCWGTRHVPGRSPWGGYDLSHTAVDPNHKVEPPKRRTPDLSLDPARSAVPQGFGLGD